MVAEAAFHAPMGVPCAAPSMECFCMTPRRPWRGPSTEEPRATPRGPCDAANRRATAMCGWRFATVCGHVAVALFRRLSNGFEASRHHGGHVGGGLACPERRLAANDMPVAWFWRISSA